MVVAKAALSPAIVWLCLVLIIELASANPSVPPRPPDTTFRFDNPVSGVTQLVLLNLLVNMALLSIGFLAVARFSKRGFGDFPDATRDFFVRFVGCIVLVTLIGAFVDYFLVTREEFTSFWNGEAAGWVSGYFRFVHPDALYWFVACVMIFTSVLLALSIVLRMHTRSSVPIAVGIASVNPVWWMMIYYLGEDVTFLTILFGILAGPILLAGVVRWHSTEYAARLAMKRGTSS